MTTQTLPAQSNSKMSASKEIPAPSDFSLPSSSGRRDMKTETTVESLASRVARHPLFAGMDQKQLALLIDNAIAVEFKKGEVIFREGEVADRFFFVRTRKGNYKIERRAGRSNVGVDRDFSIPYLELHGICRQANCRHLFLPNRLARVLRKRSLSRLRASETH